MLRKIRITLAVICFALITLLFLDFTGTIHAWFGWLAKIQFLPAVLAANFAIVAALVVVTLIFGRVYCSVICPLGVMQDIFGHLGRTKRLGRRNRYTYSKALTPLRVILLGVMVIAVIGGIGQIVALLAPYSAYGRIAQNLFAPVYDLINNGLAYLAERADSYAFYSVDIKIGSWIVFGVAALTFVIVGWLSWRNGRTYCNTVCPVGTILGYLSRFSLLAPVIDTSKCINCGRCARNCKAACINAREHAIDYTRCVACMDCIDSCSEGAISYTRRSKAAAVKKEEKPAQATAATAPDSNGRRTFLTVAGVATASAIIRAQEKKVDGGLAYIADKVAPKRKTRIVPPGAISLDNLADHCTACQLCVASCPNGVLRPSGNIATFMQPESSYENGYCRPECTRCSEACPTGAIIRIDRADKSSIQIGHAVWIGDNCLPNSEGVACGNCARHCPVGAIQMVKIDPSKEDSLEIPVVNDERCIGCGACENLCPSRPFSAIYVEGHERHRTV